MRTPKTAAPRSRCQRDAAQVLEEQRPREGNPGSGRDGGEGREKLGGSPNWVTKFGEGLVRPRGEARADEELGPARDRTLADLLLYPSAEGVVGAVG